MNLGKYLHFFLKQQRQNSISKKVLMGYNATRNKEQTNHLCHAPFKAMLLTNNGRALACCFNRQAVLGEYPKQSLKEIWFGESAKKLRKAIKNNDLSYGCFVCKNQLTNKEFNTVKARMFDHLPSLKAEYPSMLEFDLDNTCNLECIMCNPDNSSCIRSKSPLFETYKSPYSEPLLAELEDFIPHLHQVSFSGGEPFLIKLYYDIWGKIIDLKPDVRINVTTNATVLNEKIKQLLSKGFFEISVSLDSINKNTYEGIRKNADFEMVMKNLFYFRDYCLEKKTCFAVWVCPLRNNCYEIPDLIRFFGSQNIEVFMHTVWIPPKVTLWNLSSTELENLLVFYNKQKLEKETDAQINNAKRFDDYISLITCWQTMAYQREQNLNSILSLEENEEKLFNILKSQYLQKEFDTNDIPEKLDSFREKIKHCKSNIPLQIYEEGISALCQYPDEFIFQIFEAGSKKMIADFFKYLVIPK